MSQRLQQVSLHQNNLFVKCNHVFSYQGRLEQVPAETKSAFLAGILIFLTILICISVFLTVLHENSRNSSVDNKLLQQVGAKYISTIQYTEVQNVVNVSTSFKKETSDQMMKYMYSVVYDAVRSEVLSESQYHNVKKITIACMQGNRKVSVIESEKGLDPKKKFSTYEIYFPEDPSKSVNGVITS